jgi:hypothetical protein
MHLVPEARPSSPAGRHEVPLPDRQQGHHPAGERDHGGDHEDHIPPAAIPKDRAKVAGMAWWYRAAEAGEKHRHLVYRAMYLLGLTPWNRDAPHPFVVTALQG